MKKTFGLVVIAVLFQTSTLFGADLGMDAKTAHEKSLESANNIFNLAHNKKIKEDCISTLNYQIQDAIKKGSNQFEFKYSGGYEKCKFNQLKLEDERTEMDKSTFYNYFGNMLDKEGYRYEINKNSIFVYF